MTSERFAVPVCHEHPSPRVTLLRIDRPHRRNALDAETIKLLKAGLEESARRRDAAVVITGGDEFFSSGGDVASMPGPEDGVFGPAARLSLIHDLVTSMVHADQLIIGAVERYALGAAWGIVLACDLVVAADNAYFKAPFAARGMTADAGTAYHLPRRLGQQRAAAHLYLGEPLTAADARTAGLVTETVEAGHATARAVELAATLAAGPIQSNAITKSLLAQDRADLAGFLANERTAMSLAGHGADAREGQTAFLERREPNFL
ncbi:enoyl-CoA hydratase/isomerase family protein [Gordonia sp. zg691]|uniref:enoyl-CoA hydratase/isomerase family protein n=1 Tax=Gordonia jinghuaiqii TaxID=2758710 RepID=UPI00166272A3|nr:enoyl-CoA hydratase/isomerase family protein [Gordonia jinghuaiqii]MBD0862863.1 enoyl-CoA hydratase/isomerase family protein [Gordonia jinghuaiqii]